MKNHSLTYTEGDFQYLVLSSNSVILGRKTTILEKKSRDEDGGD